MYHVVTLSKVLLADRDAEIAKLKKDLLTLHGKHQVATLSLEDRDAEILKLRELHTKYQATNLTLRSRAAEIATLQKANAKLRSALDANLHHLGRCNAKLQEKGVADADVNPWNWLHVFWCWSN